MRKLYIFLLIIPMASFIYFIGYLDPWFIDFEAAKKEAKASGKPILLYFSGSDWCGTCIKLKKEVLDNESFKEHASSNLILMQADFPRLKKNQLDKSIKIQNESLAEKYNSAGIFPRLILISPEGTVIKEWNGYANQKPEDLIDQIKGCKTTPPKSI
jgi:thioredoxin-related protein